VRPRVATVLTARPWEANLVEAARATAFVRVVTRAYSSADLDPYGLDAVVAGAETSWVSPAQIAAWKRSGCRVLGVFPSGDEPARRLLAMGGADEVLPDSTSTADLLASLRLLTMATPQPGVGGRLVGVTGAHGAPGRTEIALAVATGLAQRESCLLIDLDLSGPSLSLRLGLSPEPSVVDAAAAVRSTGHISERTIRRAGGLPVVTGAFGRRPVPAPLLSDLVLAAQADYAWVVFDAGPTYGSMEPIAAEHVVFVCDASPTGIVRAAEVFHAWTGPRPQLVLNRAPDRPADSTAAVRRATGLDPIVVVPYDKRIRRAAVSGQPISPGLGLALLPLIELLAGEANATAPPTE